MTPKELGVPDNYCCGHIEGRSHEPGCLYWMETGHVRLIENDRHEASVDCWCRPKLTYVDLVTEGRVYVHKEES